MENLPNVNVFELVAKCSADLESVLKSDLSAIGRGLIELVNSVESKLPRILPRISRFKAGASAFE